MFQEIPGMCFRRSGGHCDVYLEIPAKCFGKGDPRNAFRRFRSRVSGGSEGISRGLRNAVFGKGSCNMFAGVPSTCFS